MSVEYQVVNIDYGQGIDQKTDPKAVKAGKFLRLENAVFTKTNRVTKRNGYTALPSTISDGSTITEPRLVKDFGNQLVAVSDGKVITFSDTEDAWIKAGNFTSVDLSRTLIEQNGQPSGYSDVAVNGNYALYGWSTFGEPVGTGPTGPVSSKVYATLVDLDTGNTIADSGLLSTVSNAAYITPVRCVNLGGTQLALVYVKNDATALVMRLVTPLVGGGATYGSELTITTSFVTNAATRGSWDIIATSTGASLLYSSNPGGTASVTVANIDISGSVLATNSIASANRDTDALNISQTSNGDLWLYWTTSTGGSPHATGTITYAVVSSALASVLGATVLTNLADPFYVSNMIAVNNSATQQTLYYGIYVQNVSPTYSDKTVYRTATSAGVVGAETQFAWGVVPFSRPFLDGADVYAVFCYRGALLIAPTSRYIGFQTQVSMFVVKIDNTLTIPLVVGRFAAGVSMNQCTLEAVIGFMPSCALYTGSKFLFSSVVNIQELSSEDFFYGFYFGSLSALYSYQFDFDSVSAYDAENIGGVMILNGACLNLYDGQTASEFGFHLAPEIINFTFSGTGSIAPGTYSYIAIYQWTDAQGNLHQSQPSTPFSVTYTVGNDAANISISTAYLSQKQGVSVALFRTEASGTIYYQVSDPVSLPSASAASASYIDVFDVLADSAIIGNTQPYTYPASSVLENSTPPPSMSILAHNNRLWFVDAEEPNIIWYTKTVQNLVGLSPSAFLTNQIDKKYGDIVAIAEMDEKLVSLKEQGFAVQTGDGADDTGAGSTLTAAQFVPSDVGCDNLKSVALTPDGLWTHTKNGFYMLTRSLQVIYAGMEVEDYNAQIVTAATLVPGKSQLIFLTQSGLTLVYDYIFKQWGNFTNHTGNSATPFGSTYVYSTGTQIFRQSATNYTDNGTQYKMLAQFPWLHIGIIQGFQRVRRLIMLGDFANGASASHGVQISAAYDFSASFQPAIGYLFGAASASGFFQYRERLPIQKCDTISLLIEEITTGDTAEYIDFTNIGFEAAVKRGVNKMGARYSVG